MRRIGASRTASKRRIIQSHYDEDTTDEETIHDTRTTVDTREPGVRLETQSRSCDRE